MASVTSIRSRVVDQENSQQAFRVKNGMQGKYQHLALLSSYKIFLILTFI